MKKLVVLAMTTLALVSCSGVPKTPAANNEADVRQVLNRWAKAFRVHDIKGIMSIYAAGNELVAYDIVPPLQYIGYDAYRKDYVEFLAQYKGPIEIQFRDLRVVAGDDVAFVYGLERIGGTLKNGQKSQTWVRVTTGLRKINGQWLDVHDHVSVPTDFKTGKALLNLTP